VCAGEITKTIKDSRDRRARAKFEPWISRIRSRSVDRPKKQSKPCTQVSDTCRRTGCNYLRNSLVKTAHCRLPRKQTRDSQACSRQSTVKPDTRHLSTVQQSENHLVRGAWHTLVASKLSPTPSRFSAHTSVNHIRKQQQTSHSRAHSAPLLRPWNQVIWWVGMALEASSVLTVTVLHSAVRQAAPSASRNYHCISLRT
jgi:hypothetical protein